MLVRPQPPADVQALDTVLRKNSGMSQNDRKGKKLSEKRKYTFEREVRTCS